MTKAKTILNLIFESAIFAGTTAIVLIAAAHIASAQFPDLDIGKISNAIGVLAFALTLIDARKKQEQDAAAERKRQVDQAISELSKRLALSEDGQQKHEAMPSHVAIGEQFAELRKDTYLNAARIASLEYLLKIDDRIDNLERILGGGNGHNRTDSPIESPNTDIERGTE